MPPRFFAPDLRAHATFALPDEEAHHLRQVLRLGVGDVVLVFDGQGRQIRARVERAARRGVWLTPLGDEPAAAEPTVALTVALALLKTDRMDPAVRDVTMMGAVRIQPLLTERTNAKRAAAERGAGVDRWRRIAISSAKQSGRAVVPDIRPAMPFGRFLAAATGKRLLLVEPAGPTGPTASLSRNLPRPPAATLAIGPEGGWTPDEVTHAVAAGFERLTLGSRVLRAETAPVAAMAILQYVWSDL